MKNSLKIILKKRLDGMSKQEVDELLNSCNKIRSLCVSFPYNEKDCLYFLGYRDGRLSAVLPLIYIDESLYECTAWTHPEHRREGCFKQLWQAALKHLPKEASVQFINDENSSLARLAAQSLNASKLNTQFLMELNLDLWENSLLKKNSEADKIRALISDFTIQIINVKASGSGSPASYLLQSEQGNDKLNLNAGAEIAEFSTSSYLSEGIVYFYGFSINKRLRGRGLGLYIFCSIIQYLKEQNYKKIFLQVEDSNTAAVKIYKNAGFFIAEAIEYHQLRT